MFFLRLGIIMWKNLLLRKRQYIITFLEVVLPILAAIIYVLWASGIPLEDPDSIKQVKTSEERLKYVCMEWCSRQDDNNIAYTPITPETTQVVQQVVDEICRDSSEKLGTLAVNGTIELERRFGNGKFVAAIVFPDALKALKTSPSTGNATINYEIRMKKFTTNKLLPEEQLPRKCRRVGYYEKDDFRIIGPNTNHLTDIYSRFKYFKDGFLGFQIFIEKVLTKMLTGVVNFNDTISLRNFPRPPYRSPHSTPKQLKFQLFTGTFAFLMIFMIPSITRNVVGEKQSGMTELLRSVGVSNFTQAIGWLIHSTGPHLITVTLITIFFCGIKQSDGTAVLGFSDVSLIWLALYLSIVYAAAFFYLICSLFRSPIAAVIVAIVVWVLSGFVVLAHMSFQGLIIGAWEYFICLFPVIAYLLAMRTIVMFDQLVVDDSEQPLGAQWYRINEGCPWNPPFHKRSQPNVTLLEIMIMQLFFTIVYMTLALYFESVLPSQYGVKRPFGLFKCKSKRQGKVSPETPSVATPSSSKTSEATSDSETSKVHPTSKTPPVGIDVQNVGKSFGNKVAVNGVSLQMYSGDIFALLGHNGAGKTTLISMITGWFSPTFGTIIVDGTDIEDDLEKARARMGLCPQENMLFAHLTVSEHLWIFGLLRGQKVKKVKEEIKFLLSGMGFTEKAKTSARKLSGGQKRKLCLGMALIGGTKVVILDEPTSGMDPQARREIWDLLKQLRGERTILLTTHFMEEADVLGDRIGIMAGGVLQCVGTPAYLKKSYGKGYSLKITLQEVDKEKVGKYTGALLATVQTHIPDATLNDSGRGDLSGSQIELMLPSETATTKALGNMFTDLTENRAKLKIRTMGLSQTSLEDVFLKVGELTEGKQHTLVEMGTAEDANANATMSIPHEEFIKSPKVRTRAQLLVGRFVALLIKRCISFIRKWGILLCQIVLPVLLLMIVVHFTTWLAEPRVPQHQRYERRKGVSRDGSEQSEDGCSVRMTPDSYSDPIIFYNATPDANKKIDMPSVVGPSAQYYGHVVNDLLVRAKLDMQEYKRKFIVALEVNMESDPHEIIAMYNTYPYHSAPLAINLASNIILKYLDPSASRRINLTSRPFGPCHDTDTDTDTESRLRKSRDPSSKKSSYLVNGPGIIPYVLPLALLIIVTCFIAVPIDERICQSKQLQTMSGASPALYWGSFFTFDYFIIYSFLNFLGLVYMLIFDWYRVYTQVAGVVVYLIIVMVYGFSGIIFSYLFSLRAGSVGGGFILVMLIHVVTGCAIALQVSESDESIIWIIIQCTCRFFPTYSLTRALVKFGCISVRNSLCHILEVNCEKEQVSYLTWKMDAKLIGENTKIKGPIRIAGIFQDLTILFAIGVMYTVFLLVSEYKVCSYLCNLCNRSNQRFPVTSYPNDDDVQNEADRVNHLIASDVTQDCILVQNLSRSYGNFAAVKSLTFGVHHGECFGLLGVNGAGKTTAFRMLTGDETPTTGNAYGFYTSLNLNASKFFSNIGYCPQFDGFIPYFTGQEMLQLFAGLRGVPANYRKSEAVNWLRRVGLSESANVWCKKYSGGMKRRLTTAMALIGDPALILLDEPTSGVDPVSRRQFWKILDSCRDSGQSVILTSHSMEECEALCSRLAIMVNGEFQCFGGVQHLKNKFAQGYSLTLKLKTDDYPPDSPDLIENMDRLDKRVSKKFHPCTLKDKHQNLMQYHLENPSITWDVLFKTLEKLKSEFEDFIEDFAVNETSLEEVFLAFARAQYPERKSNASCFRRCITCSC